MNDLDSWEVVHGPAPESVRVRGMEVRVGSRVRLEPRRGGDVLDLVLAGQSAIVEAIDQDDQGVLHLSVTLEVDPGRHLGEERYLGHRFFFAPEEVIPLGTMAAQTASASKILVAGIGNLFLGDDGFGVQVAAELLRTGPLCHAEVVDFGIRGLDLAYALQRPYAGVILVDVVQRGGAPGTLYLIEPDPGEEAGVATMEPHGMDPVKVLRLARAMGRIPPRAWVVGCEPAHLVDADDPLEMCMELSAPVQAAIAPAIRMIEELVREAQRPAGPETQPSIPEEMP